VLNSAKIQLEKQQQPGGVVGGSGSEVRAGSVSPRKPWRGPKTKYGVGLRPEP